MYIQLYGVLMHGAVWGADRDLTAVTHARALPLNIYACRKRSTTGDAVSGSFPDSSFDNRSHSTW